MCLPPPETDGGDFKPLGHRGGVGGLSVETVYDRSHRSMKGCGAAADSPWGVSGRDRTGPLGVLMQEKMEEV